MLVSASHPGCATPCSHTPLTKRSTRVAKPEATSRTPKVVVYMAGRTITIAATPNLPKRRFVANIETRKVAAVPAAQKTTLAATGEIH
jgi:hypothetical protein